MLPGFLTHSKGISGKMKIVRAQNGVIFIKSKLIPCTHGFATRVGGVSRAKHTASLNLAFGRGND